MNPGLKPYILFLLQIMRHLKQIQVNVLKNSIVRVGY